MSHRAERLDELTEAPISWSLSSSKPRLQLSKERYRLVREEFRSGALYSR